MRRITSGPYGPFYGCAAYFETNCKGKRDAKGATSSPSSGEDAIAFPTKMRPPMSPPPQAILVTQTSPSPVIVNIQNPMPSTFPSSLGAEKTPTPLIHWASKKVFGNILKAISVLIATAVVGGIIYLCSGSKSNPSIQQDSQNGKTPDVPSIISPSEASHAVGQSCTVKMVIRSVGRKENLLFLNSESTFQNPTNMVVLIDVDSAREFKSEGIVNLPDDFKGKTILVTGVVGTYNNHPEMKITASKNMKILKNP